MKITTAYLLRRTITTEFYPKKKYKKEILFVSTDKAAIDYELAKLELEVETISQSRGAHLTEYRQLLQAHRAHTPHPANLGYVETIEYRRQEDAMLHGMVKTRALTERGISAADYALIDISIPWVPNTYKITESPFLLESSEATPEQRQLLSDPAQNIQHNDNSSDNV